MYIHFSLELVNVEVNSLINTSKLLVIFCLYTQPKECSDCPLAQEGICQKVFKMKITKDLRKYTAPALVDQKSGKTCLRNDPLLNVLMPI